MLSDQKILEHTIKSDNPLSWYERTRKFIICSKEQQALEQLVRQIVFNF